jgi:diguanylate cyclase
MLEPEHRPEALRRSVYLWSVVAGLPIIAVVWWVRQSADPFTAVAYPLLGVVVAALGFALWRRWWHVVAIERAMIATVGAFWLSKFGYLMALGPDEPLAWLELQQSTYFTVMLFAAFVYMSFPTRVAIVIAGAAALLVALVGAARLWPDHGPGTSEPFVGFVRYVVFLGVLIGALHVLSVLKSALAASRARADALAGLAYRDPLTDLANRRGLYDALERAMKHADRHQRPLSVLLFDLDRFKTVNDRLGHDVGDRVLRGVAAAVTRVLRAGDTLGRWGGEEFLVVAPDTDPDAALVLAERLRAAVADVPVPHAEVNVTASVGVTEHVPGESYDDLLVRVDGSLYAAKAGGRDRVVVAPAVRPRPAEPVGG